MFKQTKHRVSVAIAITSVLVTQGATASMPVFDAANFLSNFTQNIQLMKIKKQLSDGGSGTIKNYTLNIEDNSSHIKQSTFNIDERTTSIDARTKNIDASTKNIDKKTVSIEKNITLNTEINTEFKWVIIKGKDEIIPVPAQVGKLIDAIKGSGDAASYAARYRSADDYYVSLTGAKKPEVFDPDFEGSRSRKAANDALAISLDHERKQINAEAEGLNILAKTSSTVQGHAKQLQVANALAGSQANQLIKMRAMMLASESARAAESLAAADKEARAIATRKHLREGLADAIAKSDMPAFAP